MEFFRVLQAEWIKKKRSFASWMVILGGFFIPLIQILSFFAYPSNLKSLHSTPELFWSVLFAKSWNTMGSIFLPMGIVLACSLICHLEFKNHAWKQLQTTPVSKSSLYFTKLCTLMIMQLQLFVLFNVGVFLSGWIPSIMQGQIPWPLSTYTIDWEFLWKSNINYYFVCLPIVIIQYNLGLHFKNIFIPIGVGLALVVFGIAAISWRFNYLIPSLFPYLQMIKEVAQNSSNQGEMIASLPNILRISGIFTAVSLIGGYLFFLAKPQNGQS